MYHTSLHDVIHRHFTPLVAAYRCDGYERWKDNSRRMKYRLCNVKGEKDGCGRVRIEYDAEIGAPEVVTCRPYDATPAWLGSSCAARAPPSTTSMCLSRTPAPTRRRPTTTTRSVAAGEGWLATPQPKLPPCARRLPRLVLLLTIRSTRTLRHP